MKNRGRTSFTRVHTNYMGHQHISIKLSSIAILKNQKHVHISHNLQLQRSHVNNMKELDS